MSPAFTGFALAGLVFGACSPAPQPQRAASAEPAEVKLPRPSADNPEALSPAPADPWKVGAFLSLSGAETQFGVETKEGIDLAVKEINQAGGVKGRPISVIYKDDGGRPLNASRVVLELADLEKVIALLGEVASSRSRSGGIVANRLGVPMLSPASTHPEVTRVGPFVFRACVTDDEQGKSAAAFVVGALKKKRGALLVAGDDLYSVGLAVNFRAEAIRLGAKIVVERSFTKAEIDFSQHLAAIQGAQPDFIFMPVYYTSMVPIARQAKARGMDMTTVFGGDGWHADTLLEGAGPEMEGARFTTHWVEDAPWTASRAFVKSYREGLGRAPSVLSAMGYDAAKMLADAMGRAAEDTRDGVRAALQATKGFQGVTGTISINEERNPVKDVLIVQVKGGRFTHHATLGAGGQGN